MGVKCCRCGHDGFAGADVALEETEHRAWFVEIFDDGFDDFFLGGGEFEGDELEEFAHDFSIDGIGLGAARVAVGVADLEVGEVDGHDFVESSAAACAVELVSRGGEMDRAQGGRARHQVERFLEILEEIWGVEFGEKFLAVVEDEASFLGESVGFDAHQLGVDGVDFALDFLVGGGGQEFGMEKYEFAALALGCADDAVPLVFAEGAQQVRRVEKQALRGISVRVLDGDDDDFARSFTDGEVGDFGFDDDFRFGVEVVGDFVDFEDLGAVFVVAREILEKIFDAVDAVGFEDLDPAFVAAEWCCSGRHRAWGDKKLRFFLGDFFR